MAERRHDILLATQPSEGKKGIEYPFRFVLVEWFNPDGSTREYSTHIDVVDRGLSNGHYHQTWEGAMQEFGERVNEHNKSFRKGNVSHIPGLDYTECVCEMLPEHDEIIDADRERVAIQERAEQTRRKLSKKGYGEYIEI